MDTNEVRVKNEPIYDSQSIQQNKEATSRKNQPNKTQSNNMQLIKNERESIPINDSKRTREEISSDEHKRKSIVAMRIKEEPIDSEMQTSKSHIESMSKEVEIKTEQKFSEMQEFVNKTSIAFLNEETTTLTEDTPTTSNSQSNKSNKLEKSK